MRKAVYKQLRGMKQTHPFRLSPDSQPAAIIGSSILQLNLKLPLVRRPWKPKHNTRMLLVRKQSYTISGVIYQGSLLTGLHSKLISIVCNLFCLYIFNRKFPNFVKIWSTYINNLGDVNCGSINSSFV